MKRKNIYRKIANVLFNLFVYHPVNVQFKFDRYVLKRYLGLETPLYKWWWKTHVKDMQRLLDYEAHIRKGYELGYIF